MQPPPKCSFLLRLYAVCSCCCCCVPVSHRKLLTSGSHVTTVAVLQGLRFVTATNGASLVCAYVRIMWACHPEHKTKDKCNPQSTLPPNFKSIRPTQQWQPYNTTERRKVHLPRNAGVPRFELATPWGVQVNYIPKGNPVPVCAQFHCTQVRGNQRSEMDAVLRL